MSTLTDRYVFAATRSLREPRRSEIARELSASIDEMAAARVDQGEPDDQAEREVLLGLGDPAALAVEYAERPTYLIGPALFPVYWRVTWLILAIAPVTVGLISALVEIADEPDVWPGIGEGIGTAFSVAIQVAFWSTLTFAIIERAGGTAHLPEWSLDRLPALPRKTQVTLADTVASLVVIGLVIVLLIAQNFRSFVPDGGDDAIAVLDPDLWSPWLALLVGVLVLSAAVEIWKYRVGRFTWPITGATAALSIAFAVPVIWLASQDRLLNPAFVTALDLSRDTVDAIGVVTICVVAAVEIGTVFDAVVKTRRAAAESRATE